MLKHILIIRNHNPESASEQNLTGKQVKLWPVAKEKYQTYIRKYFVMNSDLQWVKVILPRMQVATKSPYICTQKTTSGMELMFNMGTYASCIISVFICC